jgi:hypothetical protein
MYREKKNLEYFIFRQDTENATLIQDQCEPEAYMYVSVRTKVFQISKSEPGINYASL